MIAIYIIGAAVYAVLFVMLAMNPLTRPETLAMWIFAVLTVVAWPVTLAIQIAILIFTLAQIYISPR